MKDSSALQLLYEERYGVERKGLQVLGE
jgi:hypothetical protein